MCRQFTCLTMQQYTTSEVTATSITSAGDGVASAAQQAPAAGRPPLDQERNNRIGRRQPSKVLWDSDQPPYLGKAKAGDVILSPARSAGGFDLMGPQVRDINRVEDLQAVIQVLGRRWVFLTLTVDRKLFLLPEVAYDVANERIRKVMAELAPRGVWCAAFEVQTKTGDGWPHWHVLAWVPDGRPLAELRKIMLAKWCTKTTCRIDTSTGEVIRELTDVHPIGHPDAQHIEEARDLRGIGVYVTKYLTKAWSAVPPFMGDSVRVFRKLRISPTTYSLLEDLHRHDVKRGQRRPNGRDRRRRRRTLFQRIAHSGATLNAFEWTGKELRFCGTLGIPIDRAPEVLRSYGVRILKYGNLSSCRLSLPKSSWRWVSRNRSQFNGHRDAYVAERLPVIESAWHRRHTGELEQAQDPRHEPVSPRGASIEQPPPDAPPGGRGPSGSPRSGYHEPGASDTFNEIECPASQNPAIDALDGR